MLEDIDYNVQALSASEQPHWYWRLWTCCLGYGCLDYQVDEYPVYLIPYEPVGQFQRAASMGDLSTVQHFITSRRYHVDKYDRRNRTSLHYACVHNHPEVVMLLIENNCNINVQDDEGCTPLIKATERNNLECVSILLKHGADPHMADFTGNTALHYAVYNGNKAIASELLEYKVDINATTKHGFTPFSLAVFEKREKMAEFLTKRGANVHEVIELNSEISPGEESTSALNYDAQIITEVDDSTEHTSLLSERTSFKQPEQGTKKHVRFSEEVNYCTDPKSFCSELRPPRQLKPILKKTVQISAEMDNNTEEMSLSRLPDKLDPDIPGPTIEDNDSISIMKKISEDPEINIDNTECISIKASTKFLHQSKLVRRRAENRVRKLLGRCEVNVCSQGEPLPITSEVQTPIKNLFLDSAIEMLDKESEPLGLPPEDNSDDMLLMQKNTWGDSIIKKETTKVVCGLSGKTEVNVILEEELLPSTSEEKTYSMPLSEDSNEKKWAQLVATQYSFLNQYLKERLNEKMKEGTENSESDASDEEPLLRTSAGRTHSMQKMAPNHKLRTNYDREHTSTQSEHLSAKRSEEEEWAQLSALQYEYLNKLLRQDLKKKICKMYENSESNVCSNKASIPDKPKQRNYFKNMIEKPEKKHERKDACMHLRYSSVKRNEDIKEQDDWSRERLKELLKNDIKKILKEQLSTEHARMRKLLRKDVKKISELLRNELRQICIEQVVLLQAQLTETQQEQRTSLQQRAKKKYECDHDSPPSYSEEPLIQIDEGRQSDSHCMPLNKFIKDELKEAFCEILERNKYDTSSKKELPHISKERKQLRKIPTEQKLKTKYDSKFLQCGEQAAAKAAKEVGHVHSESQCVNLKEVIKKDFNMKICEVLEQQENNVCPKEEGLHHIFKGKTRVKEVSQEQEIKKEYNVDHASFWSQPSMGTHEATAGEQNALQYKHLKEHLQKDLQEMVHRQFEKSEVTVYPKEELPPDDSRRVMHIKVEEKKTGYLYVPHFSSFEHRLAALRATAHIEPAPDACTGGAGAMVDLDKARKAELALPLALAFQTEHPRGPQHINPEPDPEQCSDETTDPDHNTDFALDSCLLAQGKGDRLGTDPECALLCGPCDMEDPANYAELDVHAIHSTIHSSQSMNTNIGPFPVGGGGDATDHDNGTDVVSALPVVIDWEDG